MKPVDVKSNTYSDSRKKLIILILKLVMVLEYQNIKMFFQEITFQIGIFKEVFMIKIVEITVSWTYVISDFNGGKTVGKKLEKKLQKQIKKSLGLKKKSREKAINYMSNGKGNMTVCSYNCLPVLTRLYVRVNPHSIIA